MTAGFAEITDGLPTYAELLERTDAPAGSIWGLFGDDDEIAGLLGSLPLDDPEDDGDVIDVEEEVVDELGEPTSADLLDDEIIEIDVPAMPELPKGYVAEPDPD